MSEISLSYDGWKVSRSRYICLMEDEEEEDDTDSSSIFSHFQTNLKFGTQETGTATYC